MRKTAIVLVAVIILGALAVPAVAQDDEVRLDLDFKSESLNQVLQMFRRGYGLEYTLGEGVNPDMQITTHLRGVTLQQALRSIMEPNGLIAVEQNGRYVIRTRPQPQEREAQSRVVTPVVAGQDRTPPPPTRTVRDYEPRRGAAANGDGLEERDTVMEILWPMYLGADGAAMIFGGGIIEAGGAYGAGGMGGTQRGGVGGTQRGGFGGTQGGYGGSRGGFGGTQGGIGGTRGGTSNFGGTSGRTTGSRGIR